MKGLVMATLTSIVALLTGCVAIPNEYDLQKKESAKVIPAFKEAYRSKDCANLFFRYENGLNFSKSDAALALECLEIKLALYTHDSNISGMLTLDQVAFGRSFESNRAIFHHLAKGSLTLKKSRELYALKKRESYLVAQLEIERSNMLLRQGLENQRRDIERINSDRLIFLENLQRKTPVTTTCTFMPFSNSVVCETQ